MNYEEELKKLVAFILKVDEEDDVPIELVEAALDLQDKLTK